MQFLQHNKLRALCRNIAYAGRQLILVGLDIGTDALLYYSNFYSVNICFFIL